MGTVYVGLDVGSSTCHVVAITSDGIEVTNRKFDTSEKNLIAVFESICGEVHVHLEVSELTSWVRQVILPHVKRVLVGDPKRNAWIAKDPQKKDKVDATKLAHLLRMGEVHEVYYEAEQDRRDFKQVVQHFDDLTQQEVQLKQKIKSRFRVQGVIVRGLAVYGPQGRNKCNRNRSPLGRATAGRQARSAFAGAIAGKSDGGSSWRSLAIHAAVR